ncbi:MAG: GGDEF domain-containing protein [Chitinivibrionia bacterium]|nr:GGDEF domain-containing protein [Chitinivibrionia bacterium]
MEKKYVKILLPAILAPLAILFHYQKSMFGDVVFLLIIVFFVCWIYRGQNLIIIPRSSNLKRKTTKIKTIKIPTIKSSQPEPSIAKEAAEEIVKNLQQKNYMILTDKEKGAHWDKIITDMDLEIKRIISIASIGASNPTNILVFLPENEDYRLRAVISENNCVKNNVLIEKGVGFIGATIKNLGTESILLNNIDQSREISYMKEQGLIRSMIIAPVIAVRSAGFLIADKTVQNGFTFEDSKKLEETGKVIGNMLYHAYLSEQQKIKMEESDALRFIVSDFVKSANSGEILDKMLKTVELFLKPDRVTISVCENENSAKIYRASGHESEQFINMQFNPSNRETIVGLLYQDHWETVHEFSQKRYQFRYDENEKSAGNKFKSYYGIPISVNTSKGLIFLESFQQDGFSQNEINRVSEILQTVCIILYKTQNLEKQEELAIRDGLTGLYNKRQFQVLLKTTFTRSKRLINSRSSSGRVEQEISPLALVMCDIDHFKKLNDTHGHQFGDEVLKKVSKTLDTSIRTDVDYAARYGGEEFAIILFGIEPSAAYETIDRIRKTVASIEFKSPKGEKVRTSMSFGIAMYNKDAEREDELISKADEALYRSKHGGRNMVSMYSSEY